MNQITLALLFLSGAMVSAIPIIFLSGIIKRSRVKRQLSILETDLFTFITRYADSRFEEDIDRKADSVVEHSRYETSMFEDFRRLKKNMDGQLHLIDIGDVSEDKLHMLRLYYRLAHAIESAE